MKKILVVLAVTLLLYPGSSKADIKENIIDELQSIQNSLDELMGLVAGNTTDVTGSTTESPEGTTESPEATTESPEATTESPEATTESPENTITTTTYVPITRQGGEELFADSLKEGDICLVVNETNPEDLCLRLNSVLESIKLTAGELIVGSIGEKQLEELQTSDDELKEVVKLAENDEVFLASLVKDELRDVVENLNQTITDAIKEVNEDSVPPPKDNTLAIVLGTLGGVLGLVLIGVGGFMLFKKKKSKAKRRSSRGSDHGHGNTGYRMDDD